MKIIFVGRDNIFNRNLARLLSDEHEIAFCLFVEPDRASVSSRFKRIRSRIKRYGFLKVADELAFHVFDKLFLRKKEKKLWSDAVQFNINADVTFPIYNVKNIHNKGCLGMIEAAEADIIFCVCCNIIFKPALYNLPKLGTFVLHEGITPEYRGLHTTTWALMNKDFEHIGYTLLKANDSIDGGDILSQKQYHLNEGEDYKTWSWVAHNALMMGLSDIKNALKKLELNNGFVPLNIDNRKKNYYSWIGLSEFIFLYFKNYLLADSKKRIKPIHKLPQIHVFEKNKKPFRV